jgi:hypothetical protein
MSGKNARDAVDRDVGEWQARRGGFILALVGEHRMRHTSAPQVAALLLAPLAACSSGAPADAGSSPPCAVGPAARDAAVTTDASVACVRNATGPARSYDFAVTRFSVDGNQTPSATARPVFGFDLDHQRSPVTRPPEGAPHCAHGDFTSVLDHDQNGTADGRPCAPGAVGCIGGVDNQLPAVIDALGQFFIAGVDPVAALNARIALGDYALLLRVSEVNGPPGPTLCDPEVTVRIFRGVPLASRCASLTSPGQPYAIAASSLCAARDVSSVRFAFPGAIVDGRLQVFPRTTQDPAPSLEIPFTTPEGTFNFGLYNPVLRVSFGADGALSDGNLGGFWLKRDMLSEIGSNPYSWISRYLAAAAPILDGLTDIATPLGGVGALCTGAGSDGREQGGIGIGLGFTAIPAVITDTVVAAPPDAGCAP